MWELRIVTRSWPRAVCLQGTQTGPAFSIHSTLSTVLSVSGWQRLLDSSSFTGSCSPGLREMMRGRMPLDSTCPGVNPLSEAGRTLGSHSLSLTAFLGTQDCFFGGKKMSFRAHICGQREGFECTAQQMRLVQSCRSGVLGPTPSSCWLLKKMWPVYIKILFCSSQLSLPPPLAARLAQLPDDSILCIGAENSPP